MTSKTCTKCKEVKETSEFYKNRRMKDGLASQCKSCMKQYQSENRDKIAEYRRKWREDNKESERRRWREDAHRDYWNNRDQRLRQTKERSKKENERSLQLASRHRKPWEDWEIEFVLEDNGLTNYQKAVKLGRSYHTVKSYRKKSQQKEVSKSAD